MLVSLLTNLGCGFPQNTIKPSVWYQPMRE